MLIRFALNHDRDYTVRTVATEAVKLSVFSSSKVHLHASLEQLCRAGDICLIRKNKQNPPNSHISRFKRVAVQGSLFFPS